MLPTNTVGNAMALSKQNNVLESYQRGLRNLSREHGFEPLHVEGVVPKDLQGTLYLNGPGLFSLFERPYRHWFDGDGAVTAINFGETVNGAVRLVESQQLKEERQAGRPLYTSGGTLAPQWWRRLGLRFKNAANTKPLFWNKRLFALFEAGLPTEIDPTTFATLGETNLDGTVKGFFSAHFHEVPDRRAFYNFSVERGRNNILHLYEMPEGGAIRRIGSVPLPRSSAMLHDFIATENHLVFFIPPVRINILQVLLGIKAPFETMQWCPEEGTTILIIPIDAPNRYKRFKVDPFFQYHFMNGYEQGGDIVVDFVHVSEFEAAFKSHNTEKRLESFPTKGRLYRAIVKPGSESVQLEQRWEQPCEFPQVAPAMQGRKYRYGYVLASRDGEPQTKIAKLDLETGNAEATEIGANQFPSEAVFVPRAGASREGDGYLISLAYDGNVDRSFIVIFDAENLAQGPLARAWFDHHIPRPLHATWCK